jgi:hypothetical protein
MTEQEPWTAVPSEQTTPSAMEPWEHPDAIRRDIEPHRGGLILLMGFSSLILSFPIVTAPIALLLGGFAWKMGAEDRKQIRIGLIDSEGLRSTEMGQALGICGVIVSLILSSLSLTDIIVLAYMTMK